MKEFIIKQGKHSAQGLHIGFTFKNKIGFKAAFDKSCLYHFGDTDDYDINKLFGISTTWFHHQQSARIGWRPNKDKIELLTYSYNKGERSLKEHDILGSVYPDQEFECSIEDIETDYVFKFRKVGNKKWIIATDKKHKDWFLFHYFLWPYFGGNKVAPHDMKIYLDI